MSNGLSKCTLVLDENLNPRLATELTRRGRSATRVQELGLRGSADPQLLDKLDGQLDVWVLVTADGRLPDSHAEAVQRIGATIATVHPEREVGWPLEEWRREIAPMGACDPRADPQDDPEIYAKAAWCLAPASPTSTVTSMRLRAVRARAFVRGCAR